MQSPFATPRCDRPRPDRDLALQARPGYGIPSQDPRPAAQQRLSPAEAAREANSAWMGGALVAGAASGAALGVLAAGPLGVVLGGVAGAVVGALCGAAGGPSRGSTAAAVRP